MLPLSQPLAKDIPLANASEEACRIFKTRHRTFRILARTARPWAHVVPITQVVGRLASRRWKRSRAECPSCAAQGTIVDQVTRLLVACEPAAMVAAVDRPAPARHWLVRLRA